MTAMTVLLLVASLRATPIEATLVVGARDLLPIPAACVGRASDCFTVIQCPGRSVEVVADASGRNIQVEGLKPGSCEFRLGDQDFRYRVYTTGDEGTCDQAKALVRSTSLRSRCSEGYVEISGTIDDPFTRYRLEQFVASHPNVFLNLTDAVVEVTMTFLEFRDLESLDLGIDWPSAMGEILGDAVSRADAGSPMSLGLLGPVTDDVSAESIFSRFDVLEIHTVLTAVGEPLEIKDGGVIYRTVSGVETADLKEVPYGFHALVRLDPNDEGFRVNLDIEVSEPAPGPHGDDLELFRRGLRNIVHLELGQSVIIATSASRRSSETTAGLPLLSRIPLLGALFGTLRRESAPVHGAIILTMSEPQEKPEWLDRLEMLRSRLKMNP